MEGLCRLSPFCWSKRAIRVFVIGFFLIMLPIYLYIGFQPAASTEALGYPELAIPSISLTTPVQPIKLTDRQLIAPNTIAGAYNANPNKTFIIGHSSTVFQKLHNVNVGDAFSYNGKTYHIITSETVEKSAINMQEILAPSTKDTIIIMTCAGEPLPNQDATHRLIITAVTD